MPRGKVGSATYLVNIRKKKARPSDCKQCRNGSQLDGKVYCNISGSLKPVNRKWCKDYAGAFIKRKRKSRKKKRK